MTQPLVSKLVRVEKNAADLHKIQMKTVNFAAIKNFDREFLPAENYAVVEFRQSFH